MVAAYRKISTPGLCAFAVAVAVAGCHEPHCDPVSRCDVRTQACQEAALEHASCLTGRPVPDEPAFEVEVVDRDAFIEERRTRARQNAPEPAERVFQRGLALLGLASQGLSDEERAEEVAEEIAGTYNRTQRRLTIVHDGRRLDSYGNMLTLVHEMVHALQHEAGDLERDVATYDESLAYSALIEGEATLATHRAAIEGLGFRFEPLAYQNMLPEFRDHERREAVEADDPFSQLYLNFGYAFGASYLWPLRKRDPSAPAEAFANPPVSTSAVMNGDRGPVNTLGMEAVPKLDELTLHGTAHLGGFAYEVFRAKETLIKLDSVLLSQSRLPASTECVADTMSVFSRDDVVLVAWRLRFAGEHHLSDLRRQLELESQSDEEGFVANRRSRSLRIESQDDDLWILRAENAAVLDVLPETLTWTSAPASDFGFEPEGENENHAVWCPRRSLAP